MGKTILAAVTIVALVAGVAYFGLGWSSSRLELDGARVEIAQLKAAAQSQGSELSSAQDELTAVRVELDDTKTRLSALEGELEAAQLQLSAIETDAFHLHNPTFAEAVSFLAEDKTDANEYVADEYVCSHFARDVNSGADSLGIRCAYVDLRFRDSAHALIAFDTTDKGLVYFDPATDERVRPVVGQEYWRCIEARPGYYYEKPSFDDTIVDILVIW
jgi:hypothetical protein